MLIFIYIDDMLIIGRSREEIETTRDTLIYFLQHLGFLLNLKKSVLQPCQEIEFLGLINSLTLTISLPPHKVQKVQEECTKMWQGPDIDFRVDQTIGPIVVNYPSSYSCAITNSTFTTVTNTCSKIEKIISVESGIDTLSEGGTALVDDKPSALQWESLHTKPIRPGLDSNRCLKERMGAVCQGVRTGGKWSKEEQLLHINILELLAVKLALLTFTKASQIRSIHFQIDNETAISYLLKMGGTTNQALIILSKEIWEILFKKNIAITAEYLPSALNQVSDWESRNNKDSSDWKLCPLTFQKIMSRLGHPQIDLFASRLCHQLENYFSWKPDPHSRGVGALQQAWSSQLGHILYAFPPFCLIPRVLHKVVQDQVHSLILVVSVWQTQPWYPRLLQLLIASPIIIPQSPNMLLNALKEKHPLVENRTLRLTAWKVSGNPFLIRAYQDRLPTLSPAQEGLIQTQITMRPGESGLAGVLKRKLIRFSAL